MHIYNLTFVDGRTCTHIVPRPEMSEADEILSTQAIFCGRLASMERIIAPPPTKLPWVRQTKTLWTLGLFALSRLDSGEFHCSWPGGEATGDKDEISAAVRIHWQEGLT